MARRLVIAVPSGSYWHAEMALCLALMYGTTIHQCPDLEWVQIANPRSSILPQNRENAITIARELRATHLLFIDSDMYFPPDLAIRLLGHKLPVVACNCPTKAIPSNPTGWATREGPTLSLDKDGLQKFWRVGTGIMLIELAAIERFKAPNFATVWNAQQNSYTGEDWYFAEKLQKAGIALWVDHTLSKEIRHIGDFHYHHGLTHVPASIQRQLEAAE